MVWLDREEAARYFKLGADHQDVESMYKYALKLNEGDGVELNKNEALNYFKAAARNGHLESLYHVALMLD